MRGQDTTWLKDTKVANSRNQPTFDHCSLICQASIKHPPTYTTEDYKEQKGLDSPLEKTTGKKN